MIQTQNAQAPVCEAAHRSRPTLDSASSGVGPTERLLTWVRSLIDAAGDRIHALRVKLIAFLKDPVEFPDSVYGLLRCPVCRLDVHLPGDMCPKQHVAICTVCGPTLIDYWGHCIAAEPGGTHATITSSIRPATENDWQRLRFAVKGAAA